MGLTQTHIRRVIWPLWSELEWLHSCAPRRMRRNRASRAIGCGRRVAESHLRPRGQNFESVRLHWPGTRLGSLRLGSQYLSMSMWACVQYGTVRYTVRSVSMAICTVATCLFVAAFEGTERFVCDGSRCSHDVSYKRSRRGLPANFSRTQVGSWHQ